MFKGFPGLGVGSWRLKGSGTNGASPTCHSVDTCAEYGAAVQNPLRALAATSFPV